MLGLREYARLDRGKQTGVIAYATQLNIGRWFILLGPVVFEIRARAGAPQLSAHVLTLLCC